MVSLCVFQVLCTSQQVDILLEGLGFSKGDVSLDAGPGDQTVPQAALFLGAGDLDLLDSPASSGGLDIRASLAGDLDEFLEVGIESCNIAVTVVDREVYVDDFGRAALCPGIEWRWSEMHMMQCWGAGKVLYHPVEESLVGPEGGKRGA